ncbi:MAG: HDOD domain-containing protein [Phycisphaerales bacterium]
MADQAAAQREKIVDNAIQEISHIATLPEITLRIVELVEDPTSTAQDLHAVISNDPALCSRVLKVVNSAFYGLPGQVGSINRAIVLLGLNAVKNIAIAASLAKLFRGGEVNSHFSARKLWAHSSATATAAKLIADKIRLGMPDEAFLAGLMHDIGVMVEMQYDRHKLITVLEQLEIDAAGVPTNDMLEIEGQVFNADHQDFGAGLCRKWKFPRSLALVTGYHHDPFALPEEERTLALIVYVADRLVIAAEESGYRLDIADDTIMPEALAELDLTQADLDEIAAALPEQLKDVQRLLG